jgi:hypothetical protein
VTAFVQVMFVAATFSGVIAAVAWICEPWIVRAER